MRYTPILERNIEAPVCAYANKRGCLTRKMNGLGNRSWPDRLIISPNGRVAWIEFKKPGGEATPLQAAFHRKLRDMGHHPIVVDDVAYGKQVIDELVAA